MKKNIAICLLFFAGFWIVFFTFQNEKIYLNSLGIISKNYHRLEDGTMERDRIPYEKISDDNTLHWDANGYHTIKEKGYSADDPYLYAFFPMFSYIWKLSGLSSSRVIYLNFFMLMVGLLLLAQLFKQKWRDVLLVLLLPMTAIYLIPYTEATFFIMFSIAVWGYMKDRYWVYLIAMTLASISRNTLLFVVPALICAEIIFFIKDRKIRQSLIRLSMGSLPVLLGVALMAFIQGEVLRFIEAQKYWENTFSFPDLTNLRDWSTESFAINIPTLFMIGIPIIVYVIFIVLKQLNILKQNTSFLSLSSNNKSDYLNLILLFCCVSAYCSVLLFRGGSLHGLSRFVICSPYFVILLFLNHEKLLSVPLSQRVKYFVILAILSLFILLLFKKFCFGFYYLGFSIFVGIMALYLFKDQKQKRTYKILLFVLGFLSVLWTTYLYNVFICNGWLYT